MTARGSSPTPSDAALKAAIAASPNHSLEAALEAAYAVDLPSLRREAAAQALEEAATAADDSEWAKLEYDYLNGPIDGDACDAIVAWLRARAQALREGR